MTTYSIYYDLTGYCDFKKCTEYPTFGKKSNALKYLEENIYNPTYRYIVFIDKKDYINIKKLIEGLEWENLNIVIYIEIVLLSNG